MSGGSFRDGGAATDVSTRAYERIRQDIVTGALAEGERLTEASLAARLGISRTPVRAAVGRLVHEGFVERGTGYSTRVARFPEDELEQIFALRLQLEGHAARRAAQFADADEIRALRELARAMSALTESGVAARTGAGVGEDASTAAVDERLASPPPDASGSAAHADSGEGRLPDRIALDGVAADRTVSGDAASGRDELSRLNERFHRSVALAARSPRLLAMLSTAVDVGVVARTYRLYSARDLERSSRHHHEIVDAIEARAPDWAESVMRSHLLAAQASVARASSTERR